MDPEEQSQLQRLLAAVLATSSELRLPVVLRRMVEAATELVGARYGALGVLDESGTGLSDFVTVGIDEEGIEAIDHFPQGKGVLGTLIVDPNPLRLSDVTTHADAHGFPPGHPPMTSFLGAPVRVRGEVFGNLYLCDKVTGGEFTASDEELVVGLAAAAGVAVENARLHARVSDLLLLEDRERIARDLHDTVIQRLFAAGLSLQGTAARIDDPDVSERLASTVDDLDETVRHIRTTIFELQRQRLPGRSVRREVLDLVAEAGDALGFDPIVRFDGPIDSLLDGAVADHLLATTQESLSNVVRHARSPSLEITVAVTSDELLLVVRDQGVGMPDEPESGMGLVNLRSRAEDLGGKLELEPVVGGGTRLEWSVPLVD